MGVSQNKSDLTIRNYGQDWLGLLTYVSILQQKPLTIENIKNLSHNDIRNYLGHKRTTGASNTSLARHISSFRQFTNYLNEQHAITLNAFTVISIRKHRQKLPKTIPDNSFEQLIELIAQKKQTSKQPPWFWGQFACLLGLMYGCGLRISEALSLQPKDITNDTIYIIGKRQKHRQIPILPIIKELLDIHLRECPHITNEYLFFGQQRNPLQPAVFGRFFKQLLTELNLSHTHTAHSLRHSFASDLLHGGADLRSIQILLGHSNISTTSVYLHLDARKVRQTLLDYHPRA